MSCGRASLVLFPEGTRSRDGPLQPLKPGVAKLAIDNHVPIVPTFIAGARQSFLPWLIDPDIVKYHRRANPGRMKFRFASLFTSRITIRFGKPLAPDGYAENKADYLRLTAELEQVLQGMAEPMTNDECVMTNVNRKSSFVNRHSGA